MTGKKWLVDLGAMLGWDMSSAGRFIQFTRDDVLLWIRIDSRDRVIDGQVESHVFLGKNKTWQVERYLREGCASCVQYPYVPHRDHEVISGIDPVTLCPIVRERSQDLLDTKSEGV